MRTYRDIKFKIWDTFLNKMYGPDDLFIQINNGKLTSITMKPEPGLTISSTGSSLDEDRYKLIQYTNINDCDKKELYESDVVLMGETECVITTFMGSFGLISETELKLINNKNDFLRIPKQNFISFNKIFTFDFYSGSNIKLIGNSFEIEHKKELIEKQKKKNNSFYQKIIKQFIK